jgi:hypothetical protein
MKNKGSTVEQIYEIMENLDLGESSGSDKNFNDNYNPGEDFMICCDSISDKPTNT